MLKSEARLLHLAESIYCCPWIHTIVRDKKRKKNKWRKTNAYKYQTEKLKVNNDIVKIRFTFETSTPVVTVHSFCAWNSCRNDAPRHTSSLHGKEVIYGIIGYDAGCANFACNILFWILGVPIFPPIDPFPFPHFIHFRQQQEEIF